MANGIMCITRSCYKKGVCSRKMQSFSPFKPVLSGTPSEIKTATFAMWLRANAMNIRRPFDRMRWRTARPWLTYAELRYQFKLYEQRSLGAIVLGKVRLSDSEVKKAMKYEAYATRQICKADVKTMILEFYDFNRSYRTTRKEVLDKLNEEFMYLDRGYIKTRSFNWKNATSEFAYRGFLMLKPKMNEHRIAELIWHVFRPSDTALTSKEVFDKLAPTLNALGEVIHERSPLLRRALKITGYNLEYMNKREIVEKVVDRYYVRHKLSEEPLERLQFVVNFVSPIRPEDPVWHFVDLHLIPKHDWNLPGYEQAYAEEYDDAPEVTPEQEPFMRYRLPYAYIRKKQNIPWKLIIDKCERKGGTDKRTLDYANKILESMGFYPMAHCHPQFNYLKVQGLRLSTESFRSFFPEPPCCLDESLETPHGPKTLDAPPVDAVPSSSPLKTLENKSCTYEASSCSETSRALVRS